LPATINKEIHRSHPEIYEKHALIIMIEIKSIEKHRNDDRIESLFVSSTSGSAWRANHLEEDSARHSLPRRERASQHARESARVPTDSAIPFPRQRRGSRQGVGKVVARHAEVPRLYSSRMAFPGVVPEACASVFSRPGYPDNGRSAGSLACKRQGYRYTPIDLIYRRVAQRAAVHSP